MNKSYLEFLRSKQNVATDAGFEVDDLNPKLYEYEHDIVRWALKKGKSAIFAGTYPPGTLLSSQIRFADIPERASWW